MSNPAPNPDPSPDDDLYAIAGDEAPPPRRVSLPPDAAHSGSARVVQPVAAVEVRFCRTCGQRWEPHWDVCPKCAAVEARRVAIGETLEQGLTNHVAAVKSACLLYGLLLGVILVFMVVSSGGNLSVEAEFIEHGFFAAITLVWLIIYRNDVFPALGKPVHPAWFGGALLASGVTFLAASGIVKLLVSLGVPSIRYDTGFREAGFGLGAFLFSLAVLPALIEELAFRGVIQPALSRVLGAKEGLLVASFMFAILHLSLVSMPHLFALGLILGLLRQRTGSLLPGILLHFCHNLWVGLSEWLG